MPYPTPPYTPHPCNIIAKITMPPGLWEYVSRKTRIKFDVTIYFGKMCDLQGVIATQPGNTEWTSNPWLYMSICKSYWSKHMCWHFRHHQNGWEQLPTVAGGYAGCTSAGTRTRLSEQRHQSFRKPVEINQHNSVAMRARNNEIGATGQVKMCQHYVYLPCKNVWASLPNTDNHIAALQPFAFPAHIQT